MIDRQQEQHDLQQLLDKGTPQLALLYGRRRVGKTYLLNNVWPREQVFYFTASETTPEQNRLALVREFARWLWADLHEADYPTWRLVFRLLLEARGAEPIAIVLDEFQFLGGDSAGVAQVASELNAAWEQYRTPRPLVMVLSGSAVSTLESLNTGRAALYGRFNWTAKLDVFDYLDAAAMVPYRDLRDRIRLYAAFGGTPRFLAAVDPRRSVDDNIAALLLNPRGEVRQLIETALVQERGLRELPKYQAVMRAIGSGRSTLSELKNGAGLQADSDTAVRAIVDTLVSLGYVRRERNVGATNTSAFRFRIDDPALAFHFQFVAPLTAALERNAPLDIWSSEVAPHFDAYVGHVFERVADQAHRRLRADANLPVALEWGRWEGRDRDRGSLEMDIVAPLADGTVMTGGVKWNAAPLDVKWFTHHMAMLDRLGKSGVSWAHAANGPEAPLLFVAAGGFSPAFERAAKNARERTTLWTLHDLYRERVR
jgi:uncharacterized protein